MIRYIRLDIDPNERERWDQAIEIADDKYRKQMVDLKLLLITKLA